MIQRRPPQETACPACEATLGGTAAAFHRCPRCSHWFAGLNEEAVARLQAIYDAGYAGFRSDQYFQRRIREEVVERIAPRLAPPARLLDVGCGNGDFLVAASDAGYSAHGVDISTAAVDHCRQRGLTAWAADFLAFGEEGSYDVITMWDVIEHLPEPREFVRRSFRLLRPGGWLLLKTPCEGELAIRLASLAVRPAQLLVQYPSHVQFYCRNSLDQLVSAQGFDRLDWLPARKMRSSAPVRTWKKAVARLGQKTVHLLSRSGNLYLMARKPSSGIAARAA